MSGQGEQEAALVSELERGDASTATAKSGAKPFDSSHYDWARESAARKAELDALGVSTAPVPVAIAAPPAAAAAGSASPSAWNAAGTTYEDRDVTSRALPALRAALEAAPAPDAAPGALALALSAVSVSGEARVVVSRGRAKPGYDVAVEASWALRAGGGDAPAASGTLTLSDVTDADSDVIGGLKAACAATAPGGALTPAAAVAAVKGTVGHWRQVVKRWADSLVAAPPPSA